MDHPEMSLPGWAEELLRSSRTAFLATADRKLVPLGLVICFVFDGSVFHTAVDGKPKRTRALRRLRNVSENPQASLTVNHYEEDWTHLRHVIAEGRAAVLESGAEREEAIERLKAKYPQYKNTEEHSGKHPDFGAVIRLEPHRFVTWSASSCQGNSRC